MSFAAQIIKPVFQRGRAVFFIVQLYAMMTLIGLGFFPWALVSRKGAHKACHLWCLWARWSAQRILGIKTRVRGTPPTGEVMIAAKHQSFLDIIMIFSEVPAAKFIMKRELIWAPFLGLYALRIGCVPVNRGKRSLAIRKMLADVEKGAQAPGQLVIYPQGTRIPPGVKAPYKVGAGVLYQELGQTCVPVAANVGLFWPRKGLGFKPGEAVIEFLPPIEAGLDKGAFLSTLEEVVETRSNALMREAGFTAIEGEVQA